MNPSRAKPSRRQDLQTYLDRLDLTIQQTEQRLAMYESRFGRQAGRLGRDEDTSPDIGEWSGEKEMLKTLRDRRREVAEMLKKV